MINIIIILCGITMLFASSTGRVEGYIKTLSVQGFLFFLIVLLDFGKIETMTFVFLCMETLCFKTIIIPIFLTRIVRSNNIVRDIHPSIPSFYSIFIASIIFAIGFLMSYISVIFAKDVKPLYFGISFSIIITALFIIMTRKMIITHVMGYMMLENGIFLLSLSIAKEMPLIVNLGILLDIFLGIFLLGIFINKIRTTFEEINIDKLTELKD